MLRLPLAAVDNCVYEYCARLASSNKGIHSLIVSVRISGTYPCEVHRGQRLAVQKQLASTPSCRSSCCRSMFRCSASAAATHSRPAGAPSCRPAGAPTICCCCSALPVVSQRAMASSRRLLLQDEGCGPAAHVELGGRNPVQRLRAGVQALYE